VASARGSCASNGGRCPPRRWPPPTTGPLRVLDCGTGTGGFAIALARAWPRSVELTAVDISPAMIGAAQARFRREGLAAHVVQAGVYALPFAAGCFDVVIAAHVLEHLPEPVAALAEMRRVLRPGGWTVACLTRQSWLGAYIQARWRTHRLTRTRAMRWLRAAGFQTEPFDHTPGGLFDLTSLTAIGFTNDAGSTGQEMTQ
jgi:ubiquinone/menaquinone biosynthesis C-methylase UbiE